jgi:LysR family transcriptional regulator, low CO2-responsive transcriptional regulator
LIDLFASRADDLDVELSVHSPREFHTLLRTRAVDVAIGPRPREVDEAITCKPFLNYELLVLVGPDDPVARMARISAGELRDKTWLLGPSAASDVGLVPAILRRINVPDEHQRIFQSNAAAIEEAKRSKGITLAVAFAVSQDLAHGYLKPVSGPTLQTKGVWTVLTLAGRDAPPAAAELARFVTTPRATQAMVRGSGVMAGRFRPSIHVTLWS